MEMQLPSPVPHCKPYELQKLHGPSVPHSIPLRRRNLKQFALSVERFRIVRTPSRMTLYRTGPRIDACDFQPISEKVIEKLIVAFKL
jgi:hypothetical protein